MLPSVISEKSVICIPARKMQGTVEVLPNNIGFTPRARISLTFFSTSELADRLFRSDSGSFFAADVDHGLLGLRGRVEALMAVRKPDARPLWRRYFETLIMEANNG